MKRIALLIMLLPVLIAWPPMTDAQVPSDNWTLEWDASPDTVDGYGVFRSTASGPWEQIGTVTGAVLSAPIANDPTTDNCYTVAAFVNRTITDALGTRQEPVFGSYSNSACVTGVPTLPQPGGGCRFVRPTVP